MPKGVPPQKIRLMHIITGLTTGGAETMLLKLLSASNGPLIDYLVVSLRDTGTLGSKIQSLGIPVHGLQMIPSRPSVKAAWRLARLVRKWKPDLVQGWMPHGNLAALFAGSVARDHVPIFWSIRQALSDIQNEKRMTAYIIRFSARLSGRPYRIVYNSQTSARQHEELGYNRHRTVILPNGFDIEQFKPSSEARMSLRDELGMSSETPLIGLVARYHPVKGHENYLKAAKRLAERYNAVRFLLIGRGVDEENSDLQRTINRLGLNSRVSLLGERHDLPRVTAALDIATSSSRSESFSNSIGEAMLCGVPCVVTDVGDSAVIVGDTGVVVAPDDSEALAKGWGHLLNLRDSGRKMLGSKARSRIVEHYSLPRIASQYEEMYIEAVGQVKQGSR
jgi:glycosyltransferase involved in cell wall biosynthesis